MFPQIFGKDGSVKNLLNSKMAEPAKDRSSQYKNLFCAKTKQRQSLNPLRKKDEISMLVFKYILVRETKNRQSFHSKHVH